MEQLVEQVVAGAVAAPTQATAAVLAALQNRQLDVLGLVALLKRPLTDDMDHEGRAKAVQLLSTAACDAPEVLLAGDVGVIADFLAAKLKDWRCVAAAAPGCLALLRRCRQPGLAQLPQQAAVGLVQQFVGIHVQGLDFKGRSACYLLLLEVLQGPHGVPCALAGIDLASFTALSMENESDPRCLLHSLKCVQAVGALYQQPALARVSHFDSSLEDLFDIGICPYFPMMFKPPKDNPAGITREQLLAHVIDAMGCCPQFAALGVPLLSEKMGSALNQAKADALLALPACCKAWGAAAVRPHLQAVSAAAAAMRA
ncbi:Dos2-interacting transcription regulator of RNA-Pol-II-domain-containing protein [Scenedesmus sp. NREL 46B-D3]|nr:Dos2-interacting transcription regulator of RNA-Pol-II-domain-containing protein [Scenedesmus sp. NREL 46B-D3]